MNGLRERLHFILDEHFQEKGGYTNEPLIDSILALFPKVEYEADYSEVVDFIFKTSYPQLENAKYTREVSDARSRCIGLLNEELDYGYRGDAEYGDGVITHTEGYLWSINSTKLPETFWLYKFAQANGLENEEWYIEFTD